MLKVKIVVTVVILTVFVISGIMISDSRKKHQEWLAYSTDRDSFNSDVRMYVNKTEKQLATRLLMGLQNNHPKKLALTSKLNRFTELEAGRAQLDSYAMLARDTIAAYHQMVDVYYLDNELHNNIDQFRIALDFCTDLRNIAEALETFKEADSLARPNLSEERSQFARDRKWIWDYCRLPE